MQIDRIQAEQTLAECWELSKQQSFKPSSKFYREIRQVLTGTHKTYKYVLVNALLAVASDSKANPLTLQVASKLPNAFDARSLCHSVLVPFERQFLQNILGASNEPFLNKPARFPELSKSNAVRNGNDRVALNLLIKILNGANSERSDQYLKDALYVLNELIIEENSIQSIDVYSNPSLFEILLFIEKFNENSFQGISAVATVAALLKTKYRCLNIPRIVQAHKVNQAGSSSHEIADIDVLDNKTTILCVEVKDKIFTYHDVEHAFSKCKQANIPTVLFIYGNNAGISSDQRQEIENKCVKNAIFANIISLNDFSKSSLIDFTADATKVFSENVLSSLRQINASKEVIDYAHELFEDLEWSAE
jgi:hypothetical protein